MATVAVTDSSFQSDVLESDKPVLVDFWADWCGPCKMIAPALEELSDEMKEQVTIAKMDIMENPDVPGKMGVQSIPYLVLFKNGEAAANMRGAAPKGQLKQWLTMMVAHHTGAIAMATKEIQSGKSPEAKALAESIVTAQKAEIATMNKLLG